VRIGIDATCLPSALAGAGRYIHGVVRGLSDVDRDNEYFIFIKENDVEQFRALPPNIQLVCLPKLTRPLRLLWQHALAGAQAQKLSLEVWHGTHYTLPNFTNGTARVATFHDLGVFHHPQLYPLDKRIYFRRVMQQAANSAQHIISVSEATAHDLRELLTAHRTNGRTAAQSVSTIFSGVDEKFFSRVAQDEIAAVRRKHALWPPYILFVGTFEKRKNLVMLLRAFQEFCRRGHHEHVLALAGQTGNGSAEVAATIVELRLQERVRVLGYVAEANLPALYQGADLFVIPSLYEGFGFPLLEAMAGGVVALAANNSSLRELAAHPDMLCEETPSAWAAKMETLLFDHKLRYELSRYGPQRAREFSWHSTAEKLREVYKSSTPQKLAHARNGKASLSFHAAIPPLRGVLSRIKTIFTRRLRLLQSEFPFADDHANNTPQAPLKGGIASTGSTQTAYHDSPTLQTTLSLREAIQKTLAYADLFDYPLTAQELHYGLIEHAATYAEVRHELERLCESGEIAQHEGYFCLPGREASTGVRARRQRASAQTLQRYNAVLRLIKNFPFIRGVALSGALAFQNAEADDDLDLFLIVAPGRLWLAYFGLVLLMKALGKRRAVCLNCLSDGAHLAITDRDFFVAHQITFLRPLSGAEQLREFFHVNEWCARYLPQSEPAARIMTAVYAEDAVRARKRWRKTLEVVLHWRIFDAAESLIFKLYRRRIRSLTQRLHAQAIVVEPGQIKLFTNDHRFPLQERLERRLQQSQEYTAKRLEEEHNEYATL